MSFLVVLALCGLSIFSLASAAEVTITYWHSWGGYWGEGMQKMVDEFNKLHPNIKVEVLIVPDEQMIPKLTIAVVAGTPPDVVSQWAVDRQLYERIYTPLNDLIAKDPDINLEDYLPGLIEDVTYEGKISALPRVGCSTLMYYNKDIFEEVGLDPERPPKNWKELEIYSDKTTKKDAKGEYVRVGFLPWEGAGGGIQLPQQFVWQIGGKWYDAETKKVITTSPEHFRVFHRLESWAKKYNIRKISYFVETEKGFMDPFAAEKRAMVVDGDWRMSQIEKYGRKGLKCDATLLPYPEGGRPTSMFWTDATSIPRGTKHLQEAWEFVKWQNTEGERMLTSMWHEIPARYDLSEDYQNPFKKKFLEAAKYNCVVMEIPIESFYQTNVAAAVDYIIYGKKTVEQALAELQTKVQKELDRVLGK